LNRYNVLMFVMAGQKLHPDDKIDRDQKGIMMEALSYLFNAYHEKRRRLGPVAVLHPLRATALYARVKPDIGMIDLLTSLFHDIIEDIQSTDFEILKWKNLEQQLFSLLARLTDNRGEQRIIERLVCLTRREDESYYQYIWRLFSCSEEASDLVQVKLVDRLDNTLDMRIALQDPLEGLDFFQNIFQLLFVNTYKGYSPGTMHPPTEALNGAKRLYQLFKNAVLLSLIRQKVAISLDHTSKTLFNAVAEASLKEAQRTFVHVTGYHFQDINKQRELLLNTMRYCFSGKSDIVTKPDSDQPLDGLFASYFGDSSSLKRNQRLDALYQNKTLMMQASIAFIVIFLSFLNDSRFYVRGISATGIDPA